MATDDEKKHTKVLKRVMAHLQNASFDKTPPELSKHVHEIIKATTECDDPYRTVKARDNALAMRLYSEAKRIVGSSSDPLRAAIKLAIAGNVLDFGTPARFDIEQTMRGAVKTDFGIDDYERFNSSLAGAKRVLYIADNAGEVVFDRFLLDQLRLKGKEITYAVKDEPIINDALAEDAKFAGIDQIAKVIPVGGGTPGVVLGLASPEFIDRYHGADMVIAKGQGNYESLSDEPIFFLLIAKCDLIAKDLKVKVGDMILKFGGK